MKRLYRLTRSEDINRVRQKGKTFVHKVVVVGVKPNQLGKNRIAVIAGRSLGGAVQRNQAKRRIRSAIQSLFADLKQGYDIVIIARKLLLDTDYAELLTALRKLLSQAELMKVNQN